MKRTKVKGLKNKVMNANTYKLRRKVIELIHEAKKLVDLPRIQVRVAERSDEFRGMALMEKNAIWICEDFVATRATVFHEILHAVFGQEHIPGCRLMGYSSDHSAPREVIEALFVKYAKKNGGES